MIKQLWGICLSFSFTVWRMRWRTLWIKPSRKWALRRYLKNNVHKAQFSCTRSTFQHCTFCSYCFCFFLGCIYSTDLYILFPWRFVVLYIFTYVVKGSGILSLPKPIVQKLRCKVFAIHSIIIFIGTFRCFSSVAINPCIVACI